MELAKRIMESVKNLNFENVNPNGEKNLTVSLGIDHKMIHYTDKIEDFVIEADKALYYAKQHGRNCMTLYSEVKEQIE